MTPARILMLLLVVVYSSSLAAADAPRASFAIRGSGKTEYTSTERRYALSTARAAASNDCYDQKRKMASRLGTSLKTEEQEQVSERAWQSGNGWHAEVTMKFIVSYTQKQAKAELPGANEEEPISVFGVEVKPLNDLNKATKALTADTSTDFDWSHVESARNNLANSSPINTSSGNPFVQHQRELLPAQRQAEVERKRRAEHLAQQRAEAERVAQTAMNQRIRLHQEEEAAKKARRKIELEEREREYQRSRAERHARQQQYQANRQAQMQMWAQAMQTQPSYSPSTYSTPTFTPTATPAAPVPTYFQPAPATKSNSRGPKPQFDPIPKHYSYAEKQAEATKRLKAWNRYHGAPGDHSMQGGGGSGGDNSGGQSGRLR